MTMPSIIIIIIINEILYGGCSQYVVCYEFWYFVSWLVFVFILLMWLHLLDILFFFS